MRVRDFMSVNPVTVSPDDSLQTALDKMSNRYRRLPVVENNRLVGVITDRDLRLVVNSPLIMRERWEDEHLLKQTQVEGCMTPDPVTIGPDATLAEVAHQLLDGKFSGMPVVEGDNQLIGLITVSDLMRALIHIEEHLESEQPLS